jgi:hypothetical protein
MSNTKTGGSAFPRSGNEWADMAWVEAPAKDGMTLRDYFAAKALQGMLANPKLQEQILKAGQSWIEESAWKVADAMLKAREA